jgi:O-antigen ligase
MKYKQWWCVPARLWAFRLLLAAAFCSAFSLPAGRLFIALALGSLLYARIRHHERIRCTGVCGLWLAFALICLLASLQGIERASSVNDLSKLLWFGGIPVAATVIHDRHRAAMLLKAYVLGSLIRVLEILCLRIPAAWQAAEGDFLWQIIDRGSMTHGQVLMLAMIASMGLGLVAMVQRQGLRALLAMIGRFALLSIAMLANFKRGSWAAVGFILLFFGVLAGKPRLLVVLVLILVLSGFHPYVRERVGQLRNELDLKHGGRLVMWTKIAPALLEAHPYGVGFRGVTPEVMQATARAQGVRVEPHRNHLHSNFVEIPVTVGWAGFAVYLFWIWAALAAGIAGARATGNPVGRLLALTYLMMLAGLFLNGMVEYNMADGYLVLPYGMVMGVLGKGKDAFSEPPG